MTFSILLKNPSGQKETVKRTISDVSLGHSNRVQTKLARNNFQHFSYSFTHLQNRGVLQQNHSHELTPLWGTLTPGCALLHRAHQLSTFCFFPPPLSPFNFPLLGASLRDSTSWAAQL